MMKKALRWSGAAVLILNLSLLAAVYFGREKPQDSMRLQGDRESLNVYKDQLQLLLIEEKI